MKQKSYNKVTGLIFLVVAVVHGLRLLNGWELVIDGNVLPVWVSWAGVVLAGYLSYQSTKVH